MPTMVSYHKRFTELLPELAKFGVVGFIASVIDLGGAAYLHGAMGIGPLLAKAISISFATTVTYLGCRFWTFRHRPGQALLREGMIFAGLNVVGLALAESVIAVTTYGLDKKGTLAYNVASLAGTGLGTVLRYISYKKWVFRPGVCVAAEAPVLLAGPVFAEPAVVLAEPKAIYAEPTVYPKPKVLAEPTVYAGPRTG
jgi:putative flippase GtrA